MAETTNGDQLKYRNERRIKKLLVTWDFLVDMLKHNDAPFRLQVSKNALPADARYVRVMSAGAVATLIIQSQSWDEVGEGEEVPELDAPELTQIFAPELATA